VATLRTMTVTSVHKTTEADVLREEMVDKLIAQRTELGAVLSSEVEAALRTVPRHFFAPGVPWETAYANDTVRTKRDEYGTTISSISAPWLQVMMLEQAQLTPGMRVLEIGSGGYNAALLAELVGEEGKITTVDIDPEVVDRARHCLTAAGYQRVNVVLTDDGVCLKPGSVHLLMADTTLDEQHRCRFYLAMCGAELTADTLPPWECPEGCECDYDALICPECVNRAAELSMDTRSQAVDFGTTIRDVVGEP